MSTRYQGGIITANAATGYSAQFNGAASLTTTPGTTAIGFGTGSFTIEVWCYSNRLSDALCVFYAKSAGTSYDFILRYNGTTSWEIYSQTAGGRIIYAWTSPEQSALRCWVHHAIVRSGTTLKWYINGVDVSGGGISQTTDYSTNYVEIGNYANYYWDGFVSNFRIVKGTALYTSDFTPPTQLRPITGTGLLTCNQSVIADQSSFNSTINALGVNPVTPSPFSPFPAFSYNSPELGSNSAGIWTLDQLGQARATRRLNMYDPYWQNTMVMLHGNGTDGAQNNTFLDSSSNNFTVTRNGDTTQGTFTPYKPNGYWSAFFNGSSYITVGGSSTNLAPGAANFTMEAWVYSTANNSQNIIFDARTSDTGTAPVWYTNSSGTLIWRRNNTSLIEAGTIPLNQWTLITISRSGTTTRQFINGVIVGSATDSLTYTFAMSPQLGKAWDSNYWNGYISNYRFVRGGSDGIYTANYTPPTFPFTTGGGVLTALLLCQSSAFVDKGDSGSSSPYPLTITGGMSVQPFNPFTSSISPYTPALNGGSAYFDGSGDYLTIANNTSLQFGTGNFTVECWVYQPAQGGLHNTVIGKWDTGFTTTGDWSFRTRFNNVTQFAMTLKYASGYYDIQTNVNVSDSSWHHLAVVRDSSTTIKLYIDGVLRTTQTISASDIVGSTATMSVGGNVNSAPNEVASTGHVSNVRIVKGTAVYTGNFTPPTAPLTAITNTSLLLNMTNAGIIDNSMMFDWRTISTAQVSTSQKKYGTGSMFFNGSSYINIAGPYTSLSFGTANFTIEAWVYPTVNNSQNIIFDTRSSDSGTAPVWYTNSSGTLIWRRSNATLVSGGTVPINQWTFVAISRSNGVTSLFVNGVLVGSASDTASYTFTTNPQLGKAWDAFYWTGYIDDFRITMGVGRYLGNFTPPTSQLQDQ